MRVKELIERLQACDPNAVVVIADELVTDDDEPVNEGAMQGIVDLEEGWVCDPYFSAPSESGITEFEVDMSFSLNRFQGSMRAMHLRGYSEEKTNPAKTVRYLNAEFPDRILHFVGESNTPEPPNAD